jgi:hypothetical protein
MGSYRTLNENNKEGRSVYCTSSRAVISAFAQAFSDVDCFVSRYDYSVTVSDPQDSGRGGSSPAARRCIIIASSLVFHQISNRLSRIIRARLSDSLARCVHVVNKSSDQLGDI